MNISAEIIIVIDDMKPTEQPQCDPSQGSIINWVPKGPRKPNSGTREDKGRRHHCSRCGAEGRRALARLNGRCHDCKHEPLWDLEARR